MSKVLSLGSLALIVGGVLPYAYFANKFVKLLRTRHEQVWMELGSPKVMDRTSSRGKYFAYLSKKVYRKLNDASLSRSGDLARIAMYFWRVSMILALATIFTVGIICAPDSCR